MRIGLGIAIGAGTSFVPSALAGGRTWAWYAVDKSVIGNTGGLIDSISDLSGNGLNLTGVTTTRMTLTTDAGFSVIRANGASHNAKVTCPSGLSASFTMAMVAKFDNNTITSNFAFGAGNVTNARGAIIGPSAGTITNRGVRFNGVATREDGAFSTALYERWVVTYTAAGVPVLYINGVNQNLATALSNVAPTNADEISIGNLYALGSRKFYMREAIYYDRDVGAAGAAQLDTYLSRWAA